VGGQEVRKGRGISDTPPLYISRLDENYTTVDLTKQGAERALWGERSRAGHTTSCYLRDDTLSHPSLATCGTPSPNDARFAVRQGARPNERESSPPSSVPELKQLKKKNRRNRASSALGCFQLCGWLPARQRYVSYWLFDGAAADFVATLFLFGCTATGGGRAHLK
jgi:hypothetical protein